MKQDIKNTERKKISKKKKLHIRDDYACSRFSLHIEQVTIVSFQPVAPQISQQSACKELQTHKYFQHNFIMSKYVHLIRLNIY